MVLLVAGIFDYFGGAVGALFLLFLFFSCLLYVPETCSRWAETGFYGENIDSPGCQHPQPDKSPQRQLPFVAAGPLDHQRRLAGLSEVPTRLSSRHEHRSVWLSASEMFDFLLFITHTATLPELPLGSPARSPLTRGTERSTAPRWF